MSDCRKLTDICFDFLDKKGLKHHNLRKVGRKNYSSFYKIYISSTLLRWHCVLRESTTSFHKIVTQRVCRRNFKGS